MSVTSWIKPVLLEGSYAILEPLSHARNSELEEAIKDGDLWKLWYTSVPEPKNLATEVDRRLKLQNTNSMLPFCVIQKLTNTAVGMTTYMNIDTQHRRVEIGSTWYRKSVQRTPLNTECKLMLLTHAFESLNCIAVEFRTHFFNQQSRKGIERLGAKLDGILRNHSIMPNGTLRDTCVYSIIESEWPVVKEHLRWQLEKER